jgi:heme-degrading monooxygenase HmoA
METEAATTAVNSMNSLDAINYAADATKEATTAWEQAQKYLAGKQYAEARPYLLKAKGKADLAARMAKSARDTMSKETDSWRTTIDWRYKSLKSGFAERMAKFKPDQKKEMEAIFAKVDQAIEELKKEIDAQHYYKTTNMGKKTMGVFYEGEQM